MKSRKINVVNKRSKIKLNKIVSNRWANRVKYKITISFNKTSIKKTTIILNKMKMDKLMP